MPRVTTGHRGGLTLLALVATVAGAVLLIVAIRAQHQAPSPHDAGRLGTSDASSTPRSTPTAGAPEGASPRPGSPARSGPQPLGASRPQSLTIPALDVHTKVNPIGLTRQGQLAVPAPGPHLDQAAWFERSPAPGQPGPSIIEGHVDSDTGPSVFFELGRIRPGERIHVLRRDGIRVSFTVDAVRDYKKAAFPTEVVYGGDLGRPQLRLITCSDFDTASHHHIGNEVVFAHLSGVHRPRHR